MSSTKHRTRPSTVGFEISISGRDDGTLEACYILLSEAKAYRTREIIDDVLLVDYDRRGDLVGIEVLAPVKLKDLLEIIDEDRRRPFRRFLREQAPKELIAC